MDENLPLNNLLAKAFEPRKSLEEPAHTAAFRLFNGFLEGDPELVMDIYGNTLLLQDFADNPYLSGSKVRFAIQTAQNHFPWIDTVILKTRNSPKLVEQQGIVILGNNPSQKILENGTWYALDLFLNQDASLYLDTRHLRSWAKDKLKGKSVLNTFAYTGSLGVAASSGGAQSVTQTDLKEKFLSLSKISYRLNGINDSSNAVIIGDFWTVVSRLKRQGILFDCVFLDSPFFAA